MDPGIVFDKDALQLEIERNSHDNGDGSFRKPVWVSSDTVE
jgi:hypothetical protein